MYIYIYAHCLFRLLFLSIISTAYHLLSDFRAARLLLKWLIDHRFADRCRMNQTGFLCREDLNEELTMLPDLIVVRPPTSSRLGKRQLSPSPFSSLKTLSESSILAVAARPSISPSLVNSIQLVSINFRLRAWNICGLKHSQPHANCCCVTRRCDVWFSNLHAFLLFLF